MPLFRRTFSLVLALTLALAALSALAPPAAAQDSTTITIGVTDLPTSLDPGDAYDMAAWEVLSHIYTGLTRQVPGTFDYELALASDYRVSDDRLTYTFTLHDDLAFSDGTPITAQTFVDSIERVLDLRQPALQAVEPYIAGVEAAGDGELVFQLTRPVPYFLGLVSLPPYFPVHPDLVASGIPQPLEADKIGNGPYLLERFDVREQIVLTANPDYDLGPPPANETIVLRRFEKAAELRDALLNQDVDLAWRTLFLGHLFELEEVEGLTIVEKPSTRVFHIVMSQDREPTDDPLVREALTYLIERETAIEINFRGHVDPLTSLVPPLFPDAYTPLWPATPDMEYAEAVLLRAGYNERPRYRLSITTAFSQQVYGDPYASAAVRLTRTSFRDTDFVAENVFTDIESESYVRMIEYGEAQIGLFAWTPIVPHPHAYLFPLAHSSQRIPASNRYAERGLDQLLEEAALLDDDPVAQGAKYAEAVEWLLDSHALIPVWQDHVYLVAQDEIGGIEVEPNYFLHYDQLTRQ